MHVPILAAGFAVGALGLAGIASTLLLLQQGPALSAALGALVLALAVAGQLAPRRR